MEKMSSFFALVSACAKREDILLQIFDGCISVYVGSGPDRVTMVTGCGNEERCREILLRNNRRQIFGEAKHVLCLRIKRRKVRGKGILPLLRL